MRLTEPMRGFNIVGGNMIFHFALLIGSIISFNYGKDDQREITNRTYLQTMKTVEYLRWSHFIQIMLSFFRIFDKIKYGMLIKIFETINLFVYVGAILWALDHVR